MVPDETEATSMALPENIDDLLEDEVPVRSSMRLLPEEADRMSSAIQDAGLSLGRTVLDVKLPWELPGLSLVFGDSLSDLPQSSRDVLPTAVPYPVKESLEEDASSRDLGQRAKKARVSISLGACFRDVVNFNLVETDETLEEVKWTRALEMWMFVIMEDAECSAIGRKLRSKHGSDSLKCLRELFGKKASSTVAKRGSALQKFVLWLHQTNPGARALPFAAQLLDDYIEQLQRLGSKPGAFTSFTEAVNFAVHVVGLPFACGDSQNGLFDGSRVNQLFSPWARGAVALEVQKKTERKQSAVLTTDAVQYLENFLANNDEDPVDRYAAGCLLFAIFSRSRISDLRMVKSWFLDFDCLLSHGLGYLECCTRSHKTARDVAASGLAMPLIAPALGLGKVSWAVGFVQVAATVGLGFESREEGPLLPAPDQTGGWMSRSVTTAEAGAWLRQILHKGGQPCFGITGHSLKSTTLSWASKFGLEKHARLQLGHHATGDGTLNTYGRDFLAPALRKYEEMLAAVRNGSFYPDLTRSGRVQGMERAVKVEISDDETGEPGLTSFASEGSFEVVTPGAVGGKAGDDQVGTLHDHEESSSDSGSSQDAAVAGADNAAVNDDTNACAEAKPRPSWEPGYVMFKHVRTQVVHLCAQGSTSGTFACGRKMTSDFKEISHSKFLDFRKCKICEGAKPLRDTGALAQAVSSLLQRKDAA